jgi:hypothetical protein
LGGVMLSNILLQHDPNVGLLYILHKQCWF